MGVGSGEASQSRELGEPVGNTEVPVRAAGASQSSVAEGFRQCPRVV